MVAEIAFDYVLLLYFCLLLYNLIQMFSVLFYIFHHNVNVIVAVFAFVKFILPLIDFKSQLLLNLVTRSKCILKLPINSYFELWPPAAWNDHNLCLQKLSFQHTKFKNVTNITFLKHDLCPKQTFGTKMVSISKLENNTSLFLSGLSSTV